MNLTALLSPTTLQSISGDKVLLTFFFLNIFPFYYETWNLNYWESDAQKEKNAHGKVSIQWRQSYTPFLARLCKGHTNSSTLGKLFNLFILSFWLVNVDNKIFTWLLIVPLSRRNNRCWEWFWKMQCYRNLRNPIVILILVTLMIKQLRWQCWELFASVMRSGITVCAVNCVFQFLLCSSRHISRQISGLHGCIFTYLLILFNKYYWIPESLLNTNKYLLDPECTRNYSRYRKYCIKKRVRACPHAAYTLSRGNKVNK